VTIRLHAEGRRVGVTFENFGVPIPRDEIEKELIFQIGYRGRLSGDRGRLGTGIGLTDARNVARRYKGDVQVESKPASRDAAPGDYTVPYLTSVTFWLPWRPAEAAGDEKGGSHEHKKEAQGAVD
jgi:signal transduction histidine kinase